ncbi:MAG TPA: 30S ribosome-binding factor RbfA [Candidatus Kapabacteria bacterium]|nr:30S ribosome-binding factor RbfA [Candidatus Kapabacteria bacterium]
MSFRAEKIASTMKKLLAQPVSDISNEISAGLATLTTVRITKDLQLAKLYISLYGKNSKPARLIEELESRKYELKHLVGKELRLRYTPELKFYFDDTLNEMEKIQSLLSNLKEADTNLSINPTDS